MERTIYDDKGAAVAYFSDDYHETIYLWDGSAVAYLHDERHLYGINGRHLGWFIDEILYDHHGARIGFTRSSCPASVAKEEPKPKKRARDEFRSKWSAPPTPRLGFVVAERDLGEFLREGEVSRPSRQPKSEDSEDSQS